MDIPSLEIPKIERPPNMASDYVERLEEIIEGHQKELKENEALVATVILNDGSRIQVNYFGYYNPFIIRISGYDNSGNVVKVLLNQNDIQILLTVIKLKTKEEHEDIEFQKSYQ